MSIDNEMTKIGYKIFLRTDKISIQCLTKREFSVNKRVEIRLNGSQNDGVDRLVEMAWQDRTPFEAIQTEFDLSENEVKQIMKSLIKNSSFKRWRKRVQGRKTKHHTKYDTGANRFQGPW